MYAAERFVLYVYQIMESYEFSEDEDDFFDWMHERYDELYNPKYDASWKYRRPTPKQGFAPVEIYQTD